MFPWRNYKKNQHKKKKKKKNIYIIIPLYRPLNKSFPASGDFCRLLITFANSLDLDQARHFVGSYLDPNCLTLNGIPENVFCKS